MTKEQWKDEALRLREQVREKDNRLYAYGIIKDSLRRNNKRLVQDNRKLRLALEGFIRDFQSILDETIAAESEHSERECDQSEETLTGHSSHLDSHPKSTNHSESHET